MQECFGRFIRDLRKKRGMSQKDLADGTGIDFTYLSKIENCKMAPPSEKTIIAIAEALDADSDELMRLAGKIPSDLAEYLVSDPNALKALRHLRSTEGDIQTNEDWIKKISQEGKRP